MKDEDLQLLSEINSATGFYRFQSTFIKSLKHLYFYPVKDKVIQKHGKFLEWHKQVITKECFSCDGTGIFTTPFKAEECWNCDGTGIYDQRTYALAFYRIQAEHEAVYMHQPHADPRYIKALNDSGSFTFEYTAPLPHNNQMQYRAFKRKLIQFLWRFDKPRYFREKYKYYRLKLTAYFLAKVSDIKDWWEAHKPDWLRQLVCGYYLYYDPHWDAQYPLMGMEDELVEKYGEQLSAPDAWEIAGWIVQEQLYELPF